MEENEIEVRRQGHVLELVIQRPEAKNALTRAMYDALSDGLELASEDAEIRAVVIRGSDGVFSSGNDLRDFMEHPPSGADSPVWRFLHNLLTFPKPLVAAVDGWAVGIGTTLLFHCDLVYVTDRSKFQLPFVNLALVPEAASSRIVRQLAGHQRASELFLLGERFGADVAREIGFVNEVLPVEDLEARVADRVARLVAQPPESVRLTKELLRGPEREALREVMAAEGALFAQRLGSADFAEAIAAFFEKRAPKF